MNFDFEILKADYPCMSISYKQGFSAVALNLKFTQGQKYS